MSDTPTPPAGEEKEPEEKVFTFHKYNEQGEIIDTKEIKESDLTPDDCFILAVGLYQDFQYMPYLVQDMFMQRLMQDVVKDKQKVDQAMKERDSEPGGRIITLPGFDGK